MWCVTPKLVDDGTTNNSQAAQCWSLMHCQTEVPSSQKTTSRTRFLIRVYPNSLQG